MNTTRHMGLWKGAIEPIPADQNGTGMWWRVCLLWSARRPFFLGSGFISLCRQGVVVQGWTIRRAWLALILPVAAAIAASALLSPWAALAAISLPLVVKVRRIRALRIRLGNLRDVRISNRRVHLTVDLPNSESWNLSFRAKPRIIDAFEKNLPPGVRVRRRS